VLLLFGNAITGTLFLAWFIRIFPWAKKMSLRQDTWAANSLGRENLLRLFEKIDSLKLPELENAKRRTGWIARLWPMPNITERIENLNSQKSLGT
jgi:Zn-dependent protease with chaperone function